MKKLNLILAISYISIAFFLAWQIDINENHNIMASSCVLLALLSGLRFGDYILLVREEKKNELR